VPIPIHGGHVRNEDSFEHFRAIVEASADAAFVVNSQGIIVFASPAVRKMLGYEPSEMEGRHFAEFQTPETAQKLESAFSRLLSSPDPISGLEFIMVRADGSHFFAELTGAGFRTETFSGAAGLVRDISERKQAESALRNAKEYAENLIETANVMVVGLDTDGNVTVFNRYAQELSGYTRDDLAGRNWFEVLVPKDRYPEVWEEFTRLTQLGGIPLAFENPIITKTGEEHIISWQNSTLREDGAVAGTISFGIDMTERKAMEEKLRFTQLSVDSAEEMVCWISQNGRLLYVNDSFCRCHGYSREELLDMAIYDIDPNLPMRSWPERWLEDQTRGRLPFETVHNTKDGRLLPVEVVVHDVEYGGIQLNVAFHRDITERKTAEEALRESQARFKAVFENTAIGVVICDRRGQVLRANAAMEQLLGRAEAELVGRIAPDLTHPDDAAVEIPLLQELLRGDRDHYQIEKRLLRPDGTPTWVLMTRSLTRDVNGQPYLCIGMVVDLRERKKAEAELAASEAQLRQSQKMEAIGQLAGGIAHDFNNLLAAILGYSDLLLADPALSDPTVRFHLDQVKHAAERASGLTKQILAFSRRQALRPVALSLSESVRDLEPLLRRTLGEDVHLVIETDPDVAMVEADAHQIEQVIMNLALNARDAMPAGGRLTLRTANVQSRDGRSHSHPGMAPGDYVLLSVSDTGLGMDPATRERVFEPFFTTKSPGEGTGLGLSVVHGIIKQSQGHIFLDSDPGSGTSFSIYLPRASAPASRGADTSEPPVSGGTESVLLVEDEPAVRSLVVRQLSDLGYDVLEAADAEEALALFQEARERLDLLITDVVLPGATQGSDLGCDLAMRKPELCVLYMSGYPRGAIVHAGRLDEGVLLLEKPFTREALARSVREALDRAPGASRSS
jgi:two-component system cell cycle sensor histidine kinase/response regulator CckA